MSYAIVKGIKIDGDKVFLKSASNNVSPRSYDWWECNSLAKILNEQGRRAFDIEILKQYENGNFKPGTKNRYSRAIDRLHRMNEYAPYDWRQGGEGYEKATELRSHVSFDDLLYRAFITKERRQPCIIAHNGYDPPAYVKRVYKRRIPFTNERALAKRFDFPRDAQAVIDLMSGAIENYSIERLI